MLISFSNIFPFTNLYLLVIDVRSCLSVTVLDDGDCGTIRSNSRYVVPENSDQGASNNLRDIVI